ncbi:hypothetical protein OBBRIDRAFT_721574 [Obba rivulosa]|uniref:Fe2OG dioxygenase domain-containing protein n=1 Tax=Obba rivulosa TaxID=1052685 RepID=A0A8E2J5K8_9APHY|nr:hypothetical protein OBBRIDRAFT_721574 [Obba rivulosa]
MAKSGSKKTNASQTAPSPSPSNLVAFPNISPKHGLACRVLLENQILLLDGFLSSEECKNLVKFIDSQQLELTPPKKKGEAERVNYRHSITSAEIAQKLFDVLAPHIPEFSYPTRVKGRPDNATRPAHSLNSNIRMYKYTSGQYFGPHYDDSVRDAVTGEKSEWTLLLYLTGVEDGVKGGETIFYQSHKGRKQDAIVASLTRGTALLHRHGQDCMLHEGSPVTQGVKYILRSDVMFVD